MGPGGVATLRCRSAIQDEGRGDAARNVKRVKIKLADKKGALDSLAKHLGMFTDRMRMEVTDSLAQAMARAAKRVKDANRS